MAFTAKDHRMAKKIGIDLGEPCPEPTNEEMTEAILEKDGLFDEAEPTLRDWQEHADQLEKERAAYYTNWQHSQRMAADLDRRVNHAEHENGVLRAALFTSMAFSSALVMTLLVQWYTR